MAAQIALGILVVAACYHVAATVLIYQNLRRRGLPVSFLWLRLFGPKYAGQYRQLTRQETGCTGPLFYHWVVSIDVAMAAAVAGLLTL